MKVEVTMPEEYMGDVIGDMNSRRGRIEGMDDHRWRKDVRGYVPLAEMFGYSTDFVPELRDVVTTLCSSRIRAVPKYSGESIVARNKKANNKRLEKIGYFI